MKIHEPKYAKTGAVKPATWTKKFLATHSFLGFYKNNGHIPHWRKFWPSRSDYEPHQGQRECARRLRNG